MGLILDTNFVIAAEREARKRRPSPAMDFLRHNPTEEFFLTFTVAGELACGESVVADDAWKALIRPYVVLSWDLEVSRIYGAIFRDLAGLGRMIGTNDLWIAATAMRHGMPLVTNNLEEFQRVRGLVVVGY